MHRYILLSVLTIGILIAASVSAEEVISPFGDIKWGDNIAMVIKKINAIQGLEEATLEILENCGCGDDVSPISVMSLNDESVILERISQKAVPLLMQDQDNSHRTSRRRFSDDDGTYLILGGFVQEDRNSQNPKLYELENSSILVRAEPILINNIPFRITAEFDGSLGLMVKDKASLMKVTVFGNVYYLPYYLQKIQLEPIGEYIDMSILQKVGDKIYDKYKGLLSSNCKYYNKKKKQYEIVCKDRFSDKDNKHSLIFNGNIQYTNNIDGVKLDQYYRNYVVMSEKNKSTEKYKEKKDASNSL